jgi:integrase
VLAFLSSVYNDAETTKLVPKGFNPVAGVKRYPTLARQRFLNEEELARVGEVLNKAEADGSEDLYALAAIRLLLVTGCRRDEVLGARWDWVDFERGHLNLPDSKTRAKIVHLSPAALDILRRLPRVSGNPYLIVGKRAGRRWINLHKVWRRIRKQAGLRATVLHDGTVQEVRLHDLRHSFASLLAAGGASLPMIGRLLGHTNPQTTARYAHLTDDPLKRLNADAGERVTKAMRGSQP